MAETAQEWPMSDAPIAPIRMVYDQKVIGEYGDLQELSCDIQFESEHEYRDNEPRSEFWDSSDRRFRILVLSLEIVLCIQVPSDFEISQLGLWMVNDADRRVVIEHLDGEIHRALEYSTDPDRSVKLVKWLEFERLRKIHERGGSDSAPLSWRQFDEAWLDAADPSLPVLQLSTLRKALNAIARRLRK